MRAGRYTAQTLKRQDAFGTPITVNYKGEDKYKSILGGIMTVMVFAIIVAQLSLGFDKMINRTEPDYTSYLYHKSHTKENALYIPELGGQMYIGLK